MNTRTMIVAIASTVIPYFFSPPLFPAPSADRLPAAVDVANKAAVLSFIFVSSAMSRLT